MSDVERQTVHRTIPIAATPFALHYDSSRTDGWRAEQAMVIPLSGPTIPASVSKIELEIRVAGQIHKREFEPAPNLSEEFVWDRRDAWGRAVQGATVVEIELTYCYPARYAIPEKDLKNFGKPGYPSASFPRTRRVMRETSRATRVLEHWSSAGEAMGGWSLDCHHRYDPNGQVLHLGDGERLSSEAIGAVINTVAGQGEWGFAGDGGPAHLSSLRSPSDVAMAPDGRVFLADTENDRIRVVGTDGIIDTFAGGGPTANAKKANRLKLDWPTSVAIAPDGSVYVAESERILRIDAQGAVELIAGGGWDYDGEPAVSADLNAVRRITFGPDGALYLTDEHRIRRIRSDGIIETFAGGDEGFSGDGKPARKARFASPHGLTFGPDGALYVADYENHRVRRIGTDGIVSTVAGTGKAGRDEGGLPAVESMLKEPIDVAVGPEGELYIAEFGIGRVLRIDSTGRLYTAAGTHRRVRVGDGGPATQAQLNGPTAIGFGPDGGLLIVTAKSARVRRVEPSLPAFSPGDTLVGGPGGHELFVFDEDGRHLRTVDGLGQAVVHEFSYDDAGRLVGVSVPGGATVRIERGKDGMPAAIVAAGGERSALRVGEDGYLAAVVDPAGGEVALEYGEGGLLTAMRDPNGNSERFEYDAAGRLLRRLDRGGGAWSYSGDDQGTAALVTSPAGREHAMRWESMSGGWRRIERCCASGETTYETEDDGTVTITYPDGTVVTGQDVPDGRFGWNAARTSFVEARTPGGMDWRLEAEQEVVLRDPTDVSSVQRLSESYEVAGKSLVLEYDADRRRTTLTSPGGRKTVFSCDDRWRLSTVEMAGLDPVVLRYDDAFRVVAHEHGGHVTRFEHDKAGRMTGLLAPGGTLRFEHDEAGRVVAERSPGGATVRRRYDANGNLVAIGREGGGTHELAYTALGRVALHRAPETGGKRAETRYEYDADGTMVRVVDPDGRVAELEWAGSSLAKVGFDGGTLEFRHDPKRNLPTGAAGSGVEVELEYDGRVLMSERWSGAVSGRVTRTWKAFVLSGFAVEGAAPIKLTRDDDRLVTKAGDLKLERDKASGLVATRTLGTVTHKIEYTGTGQLKRATVATGKEKLLDLAYEYDAASRVAVRKEDGAATAYEYDADGRLARAGDAKYTWDANGNRSDAEYDPRDRILRRGDERFEHNASGEMTAHGDAKLSHDGLGRLTEVVRGGKRVEYLHDAWGRRVGKRVDGKPAQGLLYLEDLKPVAELDADGAVRSVFVHTDIRSAPDAIVRDGRWHLVVTDHVGSVRLVIDAKSGDVAQRLDYDAFGRVVADTNPGFQPFGFAGGLYDPDTGLTRFGEREYDPDLGRFVAPERTFLAGGGTNLYSYCFGDPVNFVDPNGHNPISVIMIVAGAAYGAGAGAAGATISGACPDGTVPWSTVLAGAAAGAIVGAVTSIAPPGRLLAVGVGAYGGGLASVIGQMIGFVMAGCEGKFDIDWYAVGGAALGGAFGGGFSAWYKAHPAIIRHVLSDAFNKFALTSGLLALEGTSGGVAEAIAAGIGQEIRGGPAIEDQDCNCPE